MWKHNESEAQKSAEENPQETSKIGDKTLDDGKS